MRRGSDGRSGGRSDPLPRFLRLGEPERLLAAEGSERHRMAMLAMWRCGLRVSEVSALDCSDVQVGTGVFVRAGKGGVDRWVPIPVQVEPYFRAWYAQRKGRGPFLPGVHGRLEHWSIRRRLASLSIEVLGRLVKPHELRHTYATDLLRVGVSLVRIRDLLGHASIATTEIYLHCLPELAQSDVDKLGPLGHQPMLLDVERR